MLPAAAEIRLCTSSTVQHVLLPIERLQPVLEVGEVSQELVQLPMVVKEMSNGPYNAIVPEFDTKDVTP